MHRVLLTAAAAVVATTTGHFAGPAAADTPTLSPRGAIVKSVGDLAGVRGTDATLFEFTLTTMRVTTSCNNPNYSTDSQQPKNGQFLRLEFRVRTGAATLPARPPLLNKGDFYTVTPDGTVGKAGNTTGTECLKEATPFGIENYLPNSKYNLVILLDAPVGPGVIGYKWSGSGGPASWEWSYDY